MRKFVQRCITSALSCVLVTPALASEPYTRVSEQADGHIVLEMCTRTFEGPHADAPRVHLVSAIHIADKPYYAEMQDLLNSYDTVLYEGVKPAGLDPIDPELDDESKVVATQERLKLLLQVARMHRSKQGSYPESMLDLINSDDKRIQSLVGSIREDAWGNTIGFSKVTSIVDGEKTVRVGFTSRGADGESGGEGINADLSELTEPIDPSEQPEATPEGIQTQLANALRVSFQLDEMDTTNPDWINADMDVNQLQHALSEYGEDSLAILSMLEGESFGAKVAGFILNFISRSPQLSSMMKLVMMDLLAFAEESDLLADQGEAMHKVIVEGRNQVVIEYLIDTIEQQPQHDEIAIFYGAGHMAGLEASLIEMGYTPAGDHWAPAMVVNPKDTGLSEMQVKMMRNMIKSS
ncbi:MAG: type II secretion system protein GspG, partial [Phycisphaerales bacterium]